MTERCREPRGDDGGFWSRPELPDWFAGSRRTLVCVSGGVDSMTLLWLMAGPVHRPEWAPRVVVGHVNHGLRAGRSDNEQHLAARFAAELGVPFRYRSLDPDAVRREAKKSGSLEEAARRARYVALRDIARRENCDALALAHHQDDLAETFLMRLLRGSGLSGLGGFAPRGDVMGAPLVRPLIDWSRDEIVALARRSGIEWAEDESNRDPGFMRNRVRHEILPFLERQSDHPPVARMLARTARRLEREARALEVHTGALYREHRLERAGPRRLGLPSWVLTEPPRDVFAPYLLRLLICDLLETPFPPAEERIRELERFARDGRREELLQSSSNIVAWMAPDRTIWVWRKTERKMSREVILQSFRKP